MQGVVQGVFLQGENPWNITLNNPEIYLNIHWFYMELSLNRPHYYLNMNVTVKAVKLNEQ